MKIPFCKETCAFLIDGTTKEQKKKKEKMPMASNVIGHSVKPSIMIRQMVTVTNCLLTCYLYIH